MSDFSQEKEIGNLLLKRKKRSLRKEKFFCVLRNRLKFLKILFPLFLFAYILFYSPFFVFKNIEVNDLKYINSEHILIEFDEVKGENFFLTDFSVLRTDVIQKYPFIDRIYTEKAFPDTVIINIREKTPFLVVKNEQGCFLLDKVGFVLKEGLCNDLKSDYSVKEVFGKDFENIDFKVNTQSNFYYAEKIFEIVSVLSNYGHNVKEISVSDQKVEAMLYDGKSFTFSLTDDIDVQLKRLIIVLKKLSNEKMSFKSLDLRYNRPVLKEE